jgi:hypothetical protein
MSFNPLQMFKGKAGTRPSMRNEDSIETRSSTSKASKVTLSSAERQAQRKIVRSYRRTSNASCQGVDTNTSSMNGDKITPSIDEMKKMQNFILERQNSAQIFRISFPRLFFEISYQLFFPFFLPFCNNTGRLAFKVRGHTRRIDGLIFLSVYIIYGIGMAGYLSIASTLIAPFLTFYIFVFTNAVKYSMLSRHEYDTVVNNNNHYTAKQYHEQISLMQNWRQFDPKMVDYGMAFQAEMLGLDVDTTHFRFYQDDAEVQSFAHLLPLTKDAAWVMAGFTDPASEIYDLINTKTDNNVVSMTVFQLGSFIIYTAGSRDFGLKRSERSIMIFSILFTIGFIIKMGENDMPLYLFIITSSALAYMSFHCFYHAFAHLNLVIHDLNRKRSILHSVKSLLMPNDIILDSQKDAFDIFASSSEKDKKELRVDLPMIDVRHAENLLGKNIIYCSHYDV